jgi:ABC-type nickel/cobalt efflux system permease component RcnA
VRSIGLRFCQKSAGSGIIKSCSTYYRELFEVLNPVFRLFSYSKKMHGTVARTTVAVAIVSFATEAFGHPMGNFSISHYAGIQVERGYVELKYLIDMAEIPTFQEMQQSGITGQPGDPRLNTYLVARGLEFAHGLKVTLNGRGLPLRLVSQNAIFPPGAGNLPTLKFAFIYRAAIPAECDRQRCVLDYRDNNFPGRAGWKEVIAASGDGVPVKSSTVPAQDQSASLANYPTDMLNSPPQVLEARIVFSTQESNVSSLLRVPHTMAPKPMRASNLPSSPKKKQVSVPKLALAPNRQATPRNAFTELMHTRRIGVGMLLLAAVIAAGLGALHALEPGHGKTIVAAYLVGSKGTARHAFLLGLIVTIAHTAGVYLLGLVTIYAQSYVVPERLYPFLAVLSGMLIAGMGLYLALQRFVGSGYAPSHSHGAGGHSHAHGGFWHAHEHEGEHRHAELTTDTSGDRPRKVSLKQLLLLGITGGIVPCPAALVVLLSALALRRVGFGLFLIVAFSFGLAAVLIGMGLAAIYAGRMLARLPTEGQLMQRWLPLASAVLITVLAVRLRYEGLTQRAYCRFESDAGSAQRHLDEVPESRRVNVVRCDYCGRISFGNASCTGSRPCRCCYNHREQAG